MQSMSDQEILGIVTPMTETMLTGWDENDREKFNAHFSEKVRQFVTKEEFDTQRAEMFPVLGTHTNLTFIQIDRNPVEIKVLWEVTCTGRPLPWLVTCVFSKSEQGVIMTAAWPKY